MDIDYERAEMNYRRQQFTHDFATAQRFGRPRRGHRNNRRERLTLVPPYGDARA